MSSWITAFTVLLLSDTVCIKAQNTTECCSVVFSAKHKQQGLSGGSNKGLWEPDQIEGYTRLPCGEWCMESVTKIFGLG